MNNNAVTRQNIKNVSYNHRISLLQYTEYIKLQSNLFFRLQTENNYVLIT